MTWRFRALKGLEIQQEFQRYPETTKMLDKLREKAVI